MIKLNLGCGNHYNQERINCDLYAEKVDVRLDATELPFKTESVDEILASQLLEHFPHSKIDHTIQEWNRVLKIDGILYVGVPDMERTLQLAKALEWIGPSRWKRISMYLYGSQTDEGQYHKCGFVPEYLVWLLENNGFIVEVVSYDTPPRPTPWFGVKAKKVCSVS
jgi:predicted SAM-dependent methyltransferase